MARMSKTEQQKKRINIRRRKWVNQQIRKRTKGKSLSNAERQRIFTQVWREAMNKIR